MATSVPAVFLALALSTGGVQELPMAGLDACFTAKGRLGGECIHKTYGVIDIWPQSMDTWVRTRSGTVMPLYSFEAKRLVGMGLAKVIDKPEAETETKR